MELEIKQCAGCGKYPIVEYTEARRVAINSGIGKPIALAPGMKFPPECKRLNTVIHCPRCSFAKDFTGLAIPEDGDDYEVVVKAWNADVIVCIPDPKETTIFGELDRLKDTEPDGYVIVGSGFLGDPSRIGFEFTGNAARVMEQLKDHSALYSYHWTYEKRDIDNAHIYKVWYDLEEK